MILSTFHDGNWLFELSMDFRLGNVVQVIMSKPYHDGHVVIGGCFTVAAGEMKMVRFPDGDRLGVDWKWSVLGTNDDGADAGLVLGNLTTRAVELVQKAYMSR